MSRGSGDRWKRLLAVPVSLLFLAACAVAPPVQEMSDARQAVQAARDAQAQRYAVDVLVAAERLLEQAARDLEAGQYRSARDAALEAKEQAMRSRSLAIRRATTSDSAL
ncbi:DUF4398 domain-containing protein [Ectothiorhodospiraceae bacterium 2226]|nr:DUF4398 domain-containing protein [Ectothiorhodospiraceae bacterium 2226]